MSFQYNKHRPFLAITLVHSPAKGIKTSIKNWGDKPENWQQTEIPQIVSRLSANTLRTATVIIDIVRETVVKNRFSENSSEEVLAHFTKKYAEQITQAKNYWLSHKLTAVGAV